jgi:HK97 family phage prohead protease
MTNIEKRGGTLGVEARADGEKRTLVGHAAVFNSDADIGGYWVERIEPGAFTKSLSNDVRALINHDTGRVIGRTKSGTLRLSEDDRGLAFEVDIPNTSDGNDLWELVSRGDISGVSFGFSVTNQSWDESVEPAVRTIKQVELYEISPCAFPAYDDTTIGKRSLDEWRSAHQPPVEQTPDPAAAPVSKAVHRARLKMDLDLKVRSTR